MPDTAEAEADAFIAKHVTPNQEADAFLAQHGPAAAPGGTGRQPAAPLTFDTDPSVKRIREGGDPEQIDFARRMYALPPDQRKAAADAEQWNGPPTEQPETIHEPGFKERMGQMVAPFAPDSTGAMPYWQAKRARVQAADAAKGGDAGLGPAVAETLGGAKDVVFGALSATPVGMGLQVAGAAAPGVVDPVMRNTVGLPGRALKATAGALGADENWQDAAQSVGDLATLRYAHKGIDLVKGRYAKGYGEAVSAKTARFADEAAARAKASEAESASRAKAAELEATYNENVPPLKPGNVMTSTEFEQRGARIRAKLQPQDGLVSQGDIDQLRAETRAAEAEAAGRDPSTTSGGKPLPRGNANMPIEEPVPTSLDDNGLPRFGGMRRGGGESGALHITDIGGAIENLGRRAGERWGGPSDPNAATDAASPDGARIRARGSPGAWISQVTRRAPDQFETLFGEPGARIGRMADEFKIEERRGQNHQRTFELATKDLTDEDAAQMTQVAEGRLPPQNEAQAKALAAWRELHPQVARENNASGARITENRTPDQLPQTIPTDWRLTQGDKGTVNITRPITEDSATFSPMKASAQARELIRARDPATIAKIAEKNVGYGKEFKTQAELDDALKSFEDDRSLKSKNPGTEMPRRIVLPDELREPDWRKTVRDYLDSANRSRAEHLAVKYREAEGPNAGAPRNPDSKGVPQGDLGDALAEIRKTQGVAAANEAEMRFKTLVGRSDVGPGDANVRAVSSAVSSLNAILSYSMKPITVLRHATQTPFLGAFLSDIDPTILPRAAATVATHAPTVYDTAIRSGAMDKIMRMPEALGETTPEGEPTTRGAKVMHGARIATNVGMSPLSAFSGVQRMVAVAAADHVVPKLVEQIRGGGWWADNAMEKFKAMRVSPERVARFVDGTATLADMDAVRQGIVNVTQGTAWADSHPAWASTPAGQMAVMGKKFEMAQTRNSATIGFDPLKRGNPIPAAALAAGTIGVGAAVLGAKKAFQGPTKSSEDPSFAGGLLEDASEGGFGGAVTKLASAITQAVKGNQGNSAVDSQVLPSLIARGIDFLNYATDAGRNAAKEDTDQTKRSQLELAGRAALDQVPAVREWVNTIAAFSPDQLQQKLATIPDTERNYPLKQALYRRIQWLKGSDK